MRRFLVSMCVLLSSSWACGARAQSREAEAAPARSWSGAVAQVTDRGAYLPLSLTPSVGTTAALGAAYGGYDGAAQAATLQSFAEARVWGPLAVRVGVRLSDSGKEVGPSLGGRAQLLRQEKHGVNGALTVFYKAEGFSEPEGEIETVVALGARVGRVLLVGNLAYGQDPEGYERDAELAAAALVRLSTWAHAGLEARGRFDLGSQRAKLALAGEPLYALDVGPTSSLALGPLAASAHVGASLFGRPDQDAVWGVVAMAGLGTAF